MAATLCRSSIRAQPAIDGSSQSQQHTVIYWSAVSQVLAFTLGAFNRRPPNQSQLSYANKELKRWKATFNSIYTDIKNKPGGGDSGVRMVPKEAAITSATISIPEEEQGRRQPECHGSA